MRAQFVLAAAFALAACKSKPTTDHKATAGANGGSSSTGALVPAPNKNNAPDIVLPRSDGSPPPKTTPLTADKITALSQLQFAGFLREVRKTTAEGLEVRHTTDSRPKILATVIVGPCGTTCTPMDLAQWKAKGDDLKNFIIPTLRDMPGLQFDIGETTLDGVKAIYTFQLGQDFKTDEDGNTTGGLTYAYILYYNDGVNQVHVVAEYKDGPMKTKEAMIASVPREDLVRVATQFADVYAHAW